MLSLSRPWSWSKAIFDTGVAEGWKTIIPADRAVLSIRATRVEPDSISSSYTGILEPYEIVQGPILVGCICRSLVETPCIDDHMQPYGVLKPTLTHSVQC